MAFNLSNMPAPGPPNFTGYEGMQGFSPDPAIDQMLTMLLQVAGPSLFGSQGMVPMGFETRNIMDRMNAQKQTIVRQQLLQQAADLDQKQLIERARGAAALLNQPWTGSLKEGATTAASFLTKMGPAFGEAFPQFAPALDAIGLSNWAMTKGLNEGMRYRTDPVTGLLGSSSATQASAVPAISELLRNSNDLRGLTPGGAGLMFQELQRRGMMAGPGSLQEVYQVAGNDGLFRAAANRAGVNMPDNLNDLSPANRDALMGQAPVQEMVRDFNSDRIVKSLKEYTGAVSAMQEIFGSNGRPNAPFNDLVNMLEELTGGSMTQLGPGRVEQLIRSTYGLAHRTGVGLDGMRYSVQAAAQLAQAAGLPSATILDTARAGLAARASYMSGVGADAEWGLGSIDDHQMLEMRLRTAAKGSASANQIGMVMRMSDALGPDAFKENSTAAAYVQAVKDGRTRFTDPVTGADRDVLMPNAALANMLQAGTTVGISRGEIHSWLSQIGTNMEFGGGDDVVGGLVRRQQGREIRADSNRLMANSILEGLAGKGIRDEGLARSLGSVGTQALFDAKGTAQRDREQRLDLMTKAMAEDLKNSAGGRSLLKMYGNKADNPELLEWLRLRAEGAYGATERGLKLKNGENAETLQNTLVNFSPEGMDRMERQLAYEKIFAKTASEMADIGKGGMLFRFAKGLEGVNLEDTDSLKKLIGETLGGVGMVPSEDQQSAIFNKFQEYRQSTAADEAILKDPASTPEQRRAAKERLSKSQKNMEKYIGEGETGESISKRMLYREHQIQALEGVNKSIVDEPNDAVREDLEERRSQIVQGHKKVTNDAREFAKINDLNIVPDDAESRWGEKKADKAARDKTEKRLADDEKATADAVRGGVGGAADAGVGDGETVIKITGKVSITDDNQIVFDHTEAAISGGRGTAWANP